MAMAGYQTGELKLPPLSSRGASPGRPQTFSPQDRSLTSQEKRTFKEKLHDAILQAEEAEMQAMREAQSQDKKSLAISMLVEGRPQAFVDFFALTHTTALSPQGPGEEAGTSAELPQDSLLMLKSQLVKADAARKAGNVEEVYGAYKHLAKYFAQLGRLRTAEFFFKQCLYISRDAGWLPGELEANLALGVVYEELHDTASAIACHERRLELANENELQAEAETAYHSLTTVYMGQAEEREAAGDVQGSLDSYNRCLRAADRAGDAVALAKANFRMGMQYYGQEKWSDTMYFLRRYIELSLANPEVDRSMEGVAHTTYAQCLQKVGDAPAAISSLESYLETMSRGADQSGPAIACCSLGILYYNQGRCEQAVTYFERFFEIARGLPDKRALDAARFNLGVARGAVRLQAYMGLVNDDLPKLIAWKNARVPFSDI
eukprot:CAMPEP_0202884152 /NCGR_PEP_ID=MMETSP1391-20130828/40487_1 /ASSEMBLY_ACC=CAM_ASM_000867 /TAXON_ID=1034604 /ORGANISM="Chlamydomonas leiostraca, Strain SAG 11-49" /LENGTH=433 /DNA_ID=CAMNT_0049567291 /DNA_START=99 /DNA_END=1400 /DNA_ORIENTATION=+